ncbi:MAG: dienelactone hydrolase family protein [Deltaproteobacteria bacterium]
MRWLLLPTLLSLAAVAPEMALAQVARMELIPFQTTTLTDQEFLVGKREGKPATIAGELRIPTPGTARLPAVVLAHGSGGIGASMEDWVLLLNGAGVATFVIDSFTGRGLVDVRNDQSQLGRLAGVVDVYRALELLGKHPRIDPRRIAVMGFSRGGQAALYASVKRFQRMHGPADAAFALYVPFYADCMTTYIGDDDVTSKPIRMFHGTADDWSPAAPCRAYVERLRKGGKDVVLTEYPDAHHAFDGATRKEPVKLEKAQTVRHCQLREVEGGRIVNGQTGKAFTYDDPCVERGTTVAFNEKARAAAQKAVLEIVVALASAK